MLPRMMLISAIHIFQLLTIPCLGFIGIQPATRKLQSVSSLHLGKTNEEQQYLFKPNSSGLFSEVCEEVAKSLVSDDYATDDNELKKYLQSVSLLRVGIPAIFFAIIASLAYPGISLWIADLINDESAFEVLSEDLSQYFQNILTTTGLMFTITVGYTYYFLYQQQEAIYLALFEEVAEAKSLLEQVSLVSEGRQDMYQNILGCIDRYVKEDLTQFFVEPSVLLSKRPIDDPLEEIMYLTSVGEPSIVYQTVRSLRRARSFRLGALQRKLPLIHFVLVWTLGFLVLFVFPFLGAGSQKIGGANILQVQSVYMSFMVFGICVVMGVLNELREPAGNGAYNVVSVLNTMVVGLIEELDGRMNGQFISNQQSPTIDGVFALGPTDDSVMYSEE
mmetsp:Transcript_18092/g.20858  ORF Transcript_18092/g.20858 Transcript_18092/m.20858 type:complete len:390 (+) Transcript_18092:54-1223(+)